MKKILLMFGLGCFLPVYSFSQVLFFEDFGGATDLGPPYNGSPNTYGPTTGGAGTWTFAPGFLLRNVDNLTPDATVSYVNEAWEVREDFGLNVSNAVAFSNSWYNPAGTANDWMWTPLIGPLPANSILSWNGRAYDPAYPDGYEVRVMTSVSGPPTGGTGILGNQITNSTQVFSVAAEQTGTWATHTVNLSAYTGQSIYVGFRNNSNDKFLLVIDDIKVEVIVNYDAQLLQVDTLTEYTKIPKSQVSPLPLEGTIKSNGVLPITNVQLNVAIFDPSMTNIFNSNSIPIPALAAGATATCNAGTWTPPNVPGTYTLKFYPDLTETDQNIANDTITRYVIVDDSTFSRDDNVSTGSLGIGAGNGGFLGNEFAIYDTARLEAVKIHFNQGYPGSKLGAVIWDMSGGYPNAIVGYTDTLLYTTAGALEYRLPMHGGDLTLNPGNYVITAIEFDSTLQIGLATNIYTQNRTWVDWPTNPVSPWGNNEDYGASFAKTYMIRAIIKPTCPSDIITGISSTPAGCGLSDGTVTVNTIGSGPFNYSWSSGGVAATDSGLFSGNYSVIVMDVYTGCTESDTVTVMNPGAPTIDSLIVTEPLCFNDANGTATVFVSGGTPGYNYLWSNGGTLAAQINLTAGTYNVTVTDGANCITQTMAVLNNPVIVGSSVVGTDESCTACNDGSATVTPSGGTGTYTYSWNPSGGTGATATNLSPGVYTITVTDGNGCTSTSTITINAFVGIEDEIGLNTTVVYPNPSNGTFTINGTLDYSGEIKLALINTLGEVVYNQVMNINKQIAVTLQTNLAPGMYILRIMAGEYITTKELILQP